MTVSVAIARFMRKFGYWPRRKELARILKCDQGALVYVLRELQENHLIARMDTWRGYGVYRLESKGWELIGIAPYEPWRKRPTKYVVDRAVNKAVERIQKMESA